MEHPKSFKLPRPFAEKWLEALRSGKYKQAIRNLAVNITEGKKYEQVDANTPLSEVGFCCLGVAGYLACNDLTKLNQSLLSSDEGKIEGVPSELEVSRFEKIGTNEFVNILTKLNDGYGDINRLKALNVREPFKTQMENYLPLKYTFSDIANFIEDNTEFYEVE